MTYDMIFAGDIIFNSKGDKFKVLKVNPKYYRSINEAGAVWNVNRLSATKAPVGTTFTAATPDIAVGFAVTVSDPRWTGVFVVSKMDGGLASLIKLGGGRGLRAPVSMLTPVDAINNFGKE